LLLFFFNMSSTVEDIEVLEGSDTEMPSAEGLFEIFAEQDAYFEEKFAKVQDQHATTIQAAQEAGCVIDKDIPDCPGCHTRKSTKEFGVCRKCRQGCQKKAISGDEASQQLLEFLQQRKKIYDRQRMKIKRVKQSRGKVLDAMAVGKKKKQADNLDAFAAGFTRYLKKSMVPATATASSAAVPTAASTTASTTDAAMSDEEVQAIASSLGQASFEETGTDRPAWVPAGSS
jgi:hypothetical protein